MKHQNNKERKSWHDPHLDEMYEIRANLNAQVSKMTPSERTKFVRESVAQYKASKTKTI